MATRKPLSWNLRQISEANTKEIEEDYDDFSDCTVSSSDETDEFFSDVELFDANYLTDSSEHSDSSSGSSTLYAINKSDQDDSEEDTETNMDKYIPTSSEEEETYDQEESSNIGSIESESEDGGVFFLSPKVVNDGRKIRFKKTRKGSHSTSSKKKTGPTRCANRCVDSRASVFRLFSMKNY
jgi:hypothetical protein